MYTHHPLQTEFFDFDTFAEENENILETLYQDSKKIVHGSFSNDEIVEERATLISMAVFNEFETINSSTEFSLVEEEKLQDFFGSMLIYVILMHLKEQGAVTQSKDGFTLTPQGNQQAQRITKQTKND